MKGGKKDSTNFLSTSKWLAGLLRSSKALPYDFPYRQDIYTGRPKPAA